NDSQQLREDAGFNWERIEKLDRLARDVVVQETIIADMQRKRFEIRSVTEPDLCSDDPTRTLLRQMMGEFAEYERKMIVLKLRGARQRKRQQSGSCEGRKPYGSRPGEREVIERMFHHYDLGSGYGGIANALNNEGLRQRNGNLWSVNTVRRILLREPLR